MFSVPTLHGGLSKLIVEDLPNLYFNGVVQKAIIDEGSIYVCGDFTNVTNITTKKSQNFTILNKNTSEISAISRIYFNAFINCCAVDGDYIYIGGSFTSFNETTKNRIIKIHKPTGTIDNSFNIGSGFNSEVFSILVDGDYIYAGGSFTTYSGLTKYRLVKINKNTGYSDNTFNIGTNLNGTVRTLAIDGNDLYVGGDFTTYQGTSRLRIVKINKNTSDQSDMSGSGFNSVMGFDNTVNVIKLDTDSVYVGGLFTNYKGIARQYIAKLSKNAILDSSFNTSTGFDNNVYSIELDDSDLYVGGVYTSYKSTATGRVAKINKTNASLDSTFNTSGGYGEVYAIAIDGNNLYVGGYFFNYKNNTRSCMVKIDKNTGNEVDINGTGFSSTVAFNNAVKCIVIHEDDLYIGGDFTSYRNDSFFTRNRIAKINAITKTIDTMFDPGVGFSSTVRTLIVDGSNLYVGGDFYSYKNNTRQYMVKIDKNTANEIDINGTGFSSDTGFDQGIYSFAVDESSLYVGGNFAKYKDFARKCFAKIDKNNASLDLSFDTSIGFDNQVSSIIVDGNNLYLSGFFTYYKNISRKYLAKINKNTAMLDNSLDTTTGFGSPVTSIILNQNDIYAIGTFSAYVDPSVIKSSYSALLSKTDSSLTTPSLVSSVIKTAMDGIVYCTIEDGIYTYLGGNFTTYNGYFRKGIVKIITSTGEIDTAFDPVGGFNGSVRSLALDGNNLYIGGSFTSYKGKPRTNITKIDKNTANEIDIDGSNFSGGISLSGGYGSLGIYSLLVDSNNLYMGGDFTSFGNNDIKKSERAALIDKTNASLSPLISKSWFNNSVFCSVVDGDYVYVGGSFTVFNGFTRNRIVKIHIPTGQMDTTFNPGTGISGGAGVVNCLVIDGDNLYVGGGFSTYRDKTRNNIIKINKNTADEVDIDGTNFSTISAFNNTIHCLIIDGSSLYVGGNFTTYKGFTRNRLVKLNKTDAVLDTNFNTTSSGGFSATVRSIVIDGSNLIVGGNFTTYKGLTRQRIVKINKNTANELNEGRITYALNADGLSISKDNGATWTNKTIANGLNTYDAWGLYAAGSNIYIATLDNGIFISEDQGTTWTNKTTANGLISNNTYDIFASGNNIYIATFYGLSISTDNGLTWTNKTTANGIASNNINKVYGYSSNIYLATMTSGLSISTDRGTTWTNKTTANGIASNNINDVFISAGKIYLATDNGLSISTDNGLTWTNKTTANGIVDNYVHGVYVSGSNIYLATRYGVSISTDNGTTWNNSIISLYANSIYANPPYVYVASDDYGVYFSTDNGSSWTQSSSLSNNGLPSDSIRDVFSFDGGFYTPSGFDNNVHSLILDGNDLYVGGNFTTYRGKSRSSLVKIDKNTATEIYAENDGFSISGIAGTINSLIIENDYLYAGGGFTYFKGDPRQYIAKINKKSAVLDFLFDTTSGFSSSVNSITNTIHGLYVGGDFTFYKNNNGNFTRGSIVKINKTTGLEIDTDGTGFSVNSGFNNRISCLVMDANNLYVGGAFTTYKGSNAKYIAKISKTNAIEQAPYISNILNGSVNSLIIDQNNLYVGGSFTSAYDGNSYTRQRIVKINTTNAMVDTAFNTSNGFNSTVNSMSLDGDNLYVGGDFNSYKGLTRQIVKIHKNTSNEIDIDGTGFSSYSYTGPFAIYSVNATLSGLRIGGNFSFLYGNGKKDARTVAKINKNTGTFNSTFYVGDGVSGFNGTPSCFVLIGNYLYIGGSFTSYAFQTTQYIAKINKDTAALDSTFNTYSGFNNSVTSIVPINVDTIFVVGYFLSYKTASRNYNIFIETKDATITPKKFKIG